jgi:hypothetical protein
MAAAAARVMRVVLRFTVASLGSSTRIARGR